MTVIDAEVPIRDSADLDGELMRAASRGDEDAFSSIVDRHKNGLINYLTHLTGSHDQAEEVAQETFLRLYRSCHRYDERGKLSSYLYSIATNLVRSEQRRHMRWLRLLPKFAFDACREEPTPQAGLLSIEACSEVRQALEKLPLHFRAPIILRDIEGWTYQEIAAALDCRVGTIKSRINRGRDRLRELLADYWNSRETRGENDAQ